MFLLLCNACRVCQLTKMHQSGESLARSPALHLILLGCAYAGQLDRAFATFEDASTVFGLSYDVHVCNALLYACIRVRNLQGGQAALRTGTGIRWDKGATFVPTERLATIGGRSKCSG
jgi:hypothetical protein